MSLSQTLLNAVFNGIGTGLGSYIAVRYIITHGEKIKEKVENKIKK